MLQEREDLRASARAARECEDRAVNVLDAVAPHTDRPVFIGGRVSVLDAVAHSGERGPGCLQSEIPSSSDPSPLRSEVDCGHRRLQTAVGR